jgi:hypothetical protein
VVELLPCAVLGGRQTTPTQWVTPSASELAGPLPWYKTIPGAADTTEEYPGYLCIAGTTTEAILAEVQGVFEFKGAVATANTPAALKLREELRQVRRAARERVERQRLLAALSASSSTPGAP